MLDTSWRARRTFYREHELQTQVMPRLSAGGLPTFLNLQQYRTEDHLIRSAPLIDLRWEHRVLGVSQDGSGVSVDVSTPGGPVRPRGSYVLACDGARSPMNSPATARCMAYRLAARRCRRHDCATCAGSS